jgi:hypothetical protein
VFEGAGNIIILLLKFLRRSKKKMRRKKGINNRIFDLFF